MNLKTLKSLVSCGVILAVPLGIGAASSQAADLPANGIWLENLDLSKIVQGYGSPHKALSVDNHPLKIKDVDYAHGIGTHAESDMAIDLKGGATRFTAQVGVDEEKVGHGSVTFEVFVDGKQAFNSGVMHGGDAPKAVSVDLTGAKRLVLHVGDGDDGIDSDHADWADAMLILQPGASTPVTIQANQVSPGNETPLPIVTNTSPVPAIHGPRITGATPGHPFLFMIPATGQGPLTYSARNLPAGLTLDSTTGIIHGSLQAPGATPVELTVRGPRGTARRELVIVSGDHKLNLTPPMGWNSWNIFHCDVDEAKVKSAADWMIKTGLSRHGYQYINIDDCWEADRDANGEIQVNKKFGNMKELGDYLHGEGFKFGIYSGPGPKTCAGYPASYEHELQDARSYAKWGVDYLKYDWCSYGDKATGEGLERFKKPYRVMGNALGQVDRDITYSLCQYGMGDVWKWGADPDVRGNLWRTTGDIGPSYSSMTQIGFSQNGHEKYAAPGHWNDPDMLFVHALKPNEQVTHITLWSILAAPLLIGSDLSKVDQYMLAVLGNDEVIDIDQDPLGIQGKRMAKEGNTEVWAKPLWDGTMAVALFNRGREKANVTARWSDLMLNQPQPVRDLWLQKDVGVFNNSFTSAVPAHGAMMFKVGRPARNLSVLTALASRDAKFAAWTADNTTGTTNTAGNANSNGSATLSTITGTVVRHYTDAAGQLVAVDIKTAKGEETVQIPTVLRAGTSLPAGGFATLQVIPGAERGHWTLVRNATNGAKANSPALSYTTTTTQTGTTNNSMQIPVTVVQGSHSTSTSINDNTPVLNMSDVDVLESQPRIAVGSKMVQVQGYLQNFIVGEGNQILGFTMSQTNNRQHKRAKSEANGVTSWGDILVRVPQQLRQITPAATFPDPIGHLNATYKNAKVEVTGYPELPFAGASSRYSQHIAASAIVVNGRSLGTVGFQPTP
ncbi:MAG: NPCBM/NEW2 domain-containing protein [Abitibacteriaceae bacterium]|nr:NPCBM/NEW2 domain-containing protein [Abditibacteriaceae bacterium]